MTQYAEGIWTPELRKSQVKSCSYISLGKETSERELRKVFVRYC